MKKNIVVLVVIFILLVLFSCDVTFMEEGRSVNEYIFPYVEFTLSEDGTYYIASIVAGATLSEIYIPSFDDYFGDAVPVLVFNGFENKDDAKNLQSITFESSQTSFSTDLFIYAKNLKTFTIETIDSQYGFYSDLAVIEKPGYEFDGWYIKGTEIRRENGDSIIAGHTILEPRWKEHDLKYNEKIEAGCTSNGHVAYYKCSSCNKLFLDKSALEEVTSDEIVIPASHKLVHFDTVKATCTESGNIEYYKCSVCSRLFTDKEGKNEITSITTSPLNHSLFFAEETVATCENNGIEAHYECEVCHSLFIDKNGKSETTSASLVIPAAGHKWTRKQYSEANSCTWDECKVCHETQNAAGHTWNAGKITKRATTTEHGTKLYTCTVCSHQKEEDIPPQGDHIWVDVEIVKTTCTERGYTLKKCSDCLIEYKDNYVDPVGHKTKYIERKEATCLAEGNTAYYVCTLCDGLFRDRNGINSTTIEAVKIKNLGHDWSSTWSIEGNYHFHECRICDSRNDIALHVYNQSIKKNDYIERDATCSEKAVYYYSCLCGSKGEGTFSIGSPLGHTGLEKHEREESTCRSQGHIEYYTCSRKCCTGRYYLDGDFKEYTTEKENLLLPYAHVFAENKYSYDGNGEDHYRVCDKCNQPVESTKAKHELTWKHTDYVHWEECSICGFKKESEDHTLGGELGERLCKVCGFSEEKAEDSKSGGFEVIEIDRKPHGYLKKEKNGLEWTFTLVSTNDKNAQPEEYIWSVNGQEIESSKNTFVLSAPEKHSYRVMCVFKANGFFASDTVVITGGE